jgi:hypothetical protein
LFIFFRCAVVARADSRAWGLSFVDLLLLAGTE